MIRPLVRSFAYTAAALWAAGEISGGGIAYSRGLETFLLTAIALSLGNHIIRPFLNILLLPINLVTLGLFRWVTSVLMLYLVTLVIPGLVISSFDFQGAVFGGVAIPAIYLTGLFAFLAVSFVVSFISSFLFWLAH